MNTALTTKCGGYLERIKMDKKELENEMKKATDKLDFLVVLGIAGLLITMGFIIGSTYCIN